MQLVNERVVEERLDCGPTTIWQLRKSDPTFPKPIYLRGTSQGKRYVLEQVEAWIARRAEEAATA